jgi:hypothetical protein
LTVHTSSAAIGSNVNPQAALPLNGRQLSQLYLLAPGANGWWRQLDIRFSGRANQENAVRFDGIEASSIIDASPGINGRFRRGSAYRTV